LLPWIPKDEELQEKSELEDLKDKLACIIEVTMSETGDRNMKEAGMFITEYV